MANFITRSTHMQVARGFYTWVDTTSNHNKKCRLLKKALTYWIKCDTAKAFRKWAQNHFKAIEGELKVEYKKVETNRKDLIRKGEEE